MVITVFGLGFVGLTTALGLASKGHLVYGIDIDNERCKMISDGKIPFLEPSLDIILKETLNKSFFISDNELEAVNKSDCVFFCVGTPYGMDGQADLKYLFSAIDKAIDGIDDKKNRVFVVKSTVPPSTVQDRIIPYLKNKTPLYNKTLGIANNPEFLREGHCWNDFINSDRIVLGVCDEKSEDILREVYKDFNCPIISVTLNTAEFIKYLSNSLLATLISYSNEMSLLADKIGNIEISRAFKILHMDKRWNNCNMTSYVYPGCGYGGYCLPKDTKALLALANSKGCNTKILENVIKTNDNMPIYIAERIMSNAKTEDKIAILGLSFKPFSDDVRQSPAMPILKYLLENGYDNINAYDPVSNDNFKKSYPQIKINYKNSKEEACENADFAVILTAWDEFKNLPKQINAKIIDCRYML